MKLPAVRKPGYFWTFLVLGLLFVVSCVISAVQEDWWVAGAQLVTALVCLSLPLRLAR